MKPEPWYQARPNPKPLFDMKAWLLKLIFSRVGPIIAAAVSAAVAWLVTFFATHLGFVMDANMQHEVALGLTTTLYAVINFFVHKYAGDNVKAIQQALGIDDDRWAGPETVKAAEKAAEYARKPEVMP